MHIRNRKEKKHWVEIAEEEALYYRMMQESLHQQMTQNDSVINSTGQGNSGTGAGGIPPYSYFHPTVETIPLIQWEPANIDAISQLGLFAYDNAESLIGTTDLSILCESNREGIDIENAPDLVTLSFPNLTTITEGGYLYIGGCPNLSKIDLSKLILVDDTTGCNATFSVLDKMISFTDIVNLNSNFSGKLFIASNPNLTTIDASIYRSLTKLSITNNPSFTTLNANGCNLLTNLILQGNELTTVDISNCNSLTELLCDDNQLTTLDISSCPLLTTLQLGQNPLTVNTVNDILITLYSGSVDNGRVNMNTPEIPAPTGAGITAKDGLLARGWSVYTN